jgi:hypothetical protein
MLDGRMCIVVGLFKASTPRRAPRTSGLLSGRLPFYNSRLMRMRKAKTRENPLRTRGRTARHKSRRKSHKGKRPSRVLDHCVRTYCVSCLLSLYASFYFLPSTGTLPFFFCFLSSATLSLATYYIYQTTHRSASFLDCLHSPF